MRLLILGCGLAGSAMAWAAHRRGWSIALIDRVDLESSSHVAAGLVTPITGTRSAATWRWDSFYEVACHHYTRVERDTYSSFWNPQPALRLFHSEEERSRAQERWQRTDSADHSPWTPKIRLCHSEELAGFHAPHGGCWMEPAARLHTGAYLAKTRAYFQSRDEFFAADIDIDLQLAVPTNPSTESLQLRLPSGLISVDAVVFCQGFEAKRNSWFSALPLHPARGDILTLAADNEEAGSGTFSPFRSGSTLPEICRTHVVHSEVWMVPANHQNVLVGATYDRHHLHGRVDEDGPARMNREILLERVQRMLPAVNVQQWPVARHQAAVRPASYDRHPLIGRHPTVHNAYVLNGLGSKGTLMAPLLAEQLCDALQYDRPIDSTLEWSRRVLP